ncbi:MAG: DJ-1/PfpI family protein [Candidatus Aminicenantes bacterium]|nr:DJ-1/PfpI family protein [Candidatus Aminicenantes bacterium]
MKLKFFSAGIISICLIFSTSGFSLPLSQKSDESHLTVLVLLGEWFGDAYFPLAKEIESRGWVMKRIGIENDYRGCYNKDRSIALSSDILIQDLKDFSGYDALIIPSGPQFRKFQENPAVLHFIRDAHDAGMLIASFCAGNYLVNESGLLDSSEVIGLFPKKVTMVREGILLGPRGGGPPPGDGFKSAPIEEICDAISLEIKKRKGKEGILP